MLYNLKFFRKGNEIFSINDENIPDYFYIIKSGKVREIYKFPRVNKNGQIVFENQIRVLKQNDFLGVVACMADRNYISSAEALEETCVIIIYRKQFASIYQSFPELAFRIINYFSEQLRNYNTALAEMKNGIAGNPELLPIYLSWLNTALPVSDITMRYTRIQAI